MKIDIIDLSHAEPTIVRDYRVVITDSKGACVTNVTILIDMRELSSLARRAVENDSGEAVLYYGAIKAKVT